MVTLIHRPGSQSGWMWRWEDFVIKREPNLKLHKHFIMLEYRHLKVAKVCGTYIHRRVASESMA